MDNSGKSSLIKYFSTGKFIPILSRTNGMEVSRMLIGSEELPLMFLDVGGLKAFQKTLWDPVLDSIPDAILYVVDSSDINRIDANLSAFALVMENKAIAQVPLLIVANKIDLEEDNMLPGTALALSMELIDYKIRQRSREISLIPVSLKNDINVNQVVEWIYRVVYYSPRRKESDLSLND